MRITQKIMFGNFMKDINENRSQLGKVQSDLSSGRSVRKPSADPIAFQRSRIIEENIRKEGQYQQNIDSGLRQARMAQEALDETVDRLIDIKSIIVKGASSSSNESSRRNMADEIAGIRDSLISTLNLSYGDRFLFAGTNSASRPFEKDATAVGGVADNSNNQPPQVTVADGVQVDISTTGDKIRSTSAGDMFEVISNIEDALRNNDTEAVNQLLASSEDMIEHVSDINARVGTNINRMDFVYEQYESAKIAQKSDVSKLVDTDYAKAFSELQRIEVAFESAMAAHSTMIGNTLLDYI